jgi:hypothetical protein
VDCRLDGLLVGRHALVEGPRAGTAEAEPLAADTQEATGWQAAPNRARDPQDLIDRQRVGRTRRDRRPKRELLEGQVDERTGLDADDLVEDESGPVRGDVDDVEGVELAAAADLQQPAGGRLEARQDVGRGAQRRAVVAAIRVSADEQPQRRSRRVHADLRSIDTSRKCVAQEMHGS